jgi:AraC family transcriptional regulator
MRAADGVISWPGMRSEYSWIPPGEDSGSTKPHQIGVSFSGHRNAVHQTASRVGESDIAPGSVFLTASEPIRWLSVREVSESLEMYPDPDMLANIAGRRVEVEPVFGGEDPVVVGVASMLKRAHLQPGSVENLQASALAHLLIRHLLERYAGLRLERSSGTRLDPRTLARIDLFMKSVLAQAISLEDLAAVARMSPFHFNRAFRRSTGLPPHQYLTMLRMERAKGLLLENRKTVEEIAKSVGFRNLSHFRRQFRRFAGFKVSDLRPPLF